MLFDTLCFVSLPVGQVKPQNNLPEWFQLASGKRQAIISHPSLSANLGRFSQTKLFDRAVFTQGCILICFSAIRSFETDYSVEVD